MHTHNDAFCPQVPAKQIGCTDSHRRRLSSRLVHTHLDLSAWPWACGKAGDSAPPGVGHAKATASVSHVGAPSERAPIACSHTASHGSNRACAEMALEGVPVPSTPVKSAAQTLFVVTKR